MKAIITAKNADFNAANAFSAFHVKQLPRFLQKKCFT